MQKYFAFKNQITGYRDVEETVKVVEKEAASHIHLLKKRSSLLGEYKNDVINVMYRLQQFYSNQSSPYLKSNGNHKKVLLLVAGDRGIVGGLYHKLISKVMEIKNDYEEIWVLGEKAKKYLDEENIEVKQFFYQEKDLPGTEEIRNLSRGFMETFLNGEVGYIDILYPQFFSIASQEPVFVKFLPIDFASVNHDINQAQENDYGEGLPIFEPGKETVFNTLLKRYLDIFFAHIVYESKLSEFSSRTVTAEHAVSKTSEMINKLQLEFLKERRIAITQRQIEIFSAHNSI
jgi:F-type H+-transporting ATPase subunit gamma